MAKRHLSGQGETARAISASASNRDTMTPSFYLFNSEFLVNFDTNCRSIRYKLQRVWQGDIAKIEMLANLQVGNIQIALIWNIQRKTLEHDTLMLDKHLTAEVNTLGNTGEDNGHFETAWFLEIDFAEIGMYQGVADRISLHFTNQNVLVTFSINFQGIIALRR